MKKSVLTTIGLVSIGVIGLMTTVPFVTSCSSISSELFTSPGSEEFFTEVKSKKFIHEYISNKGKPQDYSKRNSTDSDVIKKINNLIKPKDMVFLMAWDVLQMFDNDETKIVDNCLDVCFQISKYSDNSFSFSEYWTDKSFTGWSDGVSNPTGALRSAQTVSDTHIKVEEVGTDLKNDTWEIVFAPISNDYRLVLNSWSIDKNPDGTPAKTESLNNKNDFTWTLPLAAAEILFPGWKMPVIV